MYSLKHYYLLAAGSQVAKRSWMMYCMNERRKQATIDFNAAIQEYYALLMQCTTMFILLCVCCEMLKTFFA